MATSFKTNPVSLRDLLADCERGRIQLPDFQRSWVWDEERIKGLIASISQAFPVGALMMLETGGDVNFAPRLIQGAPQPTPKVAPSLLLLDGQQRMTSLYQTTRRKEVVHTVTARNAKVARWYYIDMKAALDAEISRDEAVIGVPADKVLRANFGREVVLDLSSAPLEYEKMMFPLNCIFDWYDWGRGYDQFWKDDEGASSLFDRFRKLILDAFQNYLVPVITLERDTSKEAVCLVFEKVNTGGKALDAFELVTAIYAADNFQLRDDWAAREGRLKAHAVLKNISSTDFMQAISLLHTKALRDQARLAGLEPPAVSATRQSLLKLPLEAYKDWADKVEAGFVLAARFLRQRKVYYAGDLPYQSQVPVLAALLVTLDKKWENDSVRQKLALWYWNGVFGELYGSATESRLARDMVEVPTWIDGGFEPSTIVQSTFDANRLNSMRSRLSAAYKGLSALLMQEGANDFRSGQDYGDTISAAEKVDIHHIFPKAWCVKAGLEWQDFDSIINKTPLSARTNRILGGVAPSAYVQRLEAGWADHPGIVPERVDLHLVSHLIDPASLRSDDFASFFAKRREALIGLIETATGKAVHRGEGANEAEDYSDDAEAPSEDLIAAEAGPITDADSVDLVPETM